MKKNHPHHKKEEHALTNMNSTDWGLRLVKTEFYSAEKNFNGINLSNIGAEFLDELTILKEIGCSIFQGAEGNNN
eukprot:2104553-Ditylum_brightwellii.AAC.1